MKILRISLLWLVYAMSPATGLTQVMEGLKPVIDYQASDSIWNDALLGMTQSPSANQGQGASGFSPFGGSLWGQPGIFPALPVNEVISLMPGAKSAIPSVLDDITSLLPSSGAAAPQAVGPTSSGPPIMPWTGFYVGPGPYGQAASPGSPPSPFILFAPTDMPSLASPGASGTIPSVLDDVTSLLPSSAAMTGGNAMGVRTGYAVEISGDMSAWR